MPALGMMVEGATFEAIHQVMKRELPRSKRYDTVKLRIWTVLIASLMLCMRSDESVNSGAHLFNIITA